MTHIRAGILLLLVQSLSVLSMAGKYLYERKTEPRVWARCEQDLSHGSYLGLHLLLNACALPRDQANYTQAYHWIAQENQPPSTQPASWQWDVSLHVFGGRLVPVPVEHPRAPAERQEIRIIDGGPCDRVSFPPTLNLFLPKYAVSSLPLKPSQELWVEVTVPAQGPPRAIQLALSDASGFHKLQ